VLYSCTYFFSCLVFAGKAGTHLDQAPLCAWWGYCLTLKDQTRREISTRVKQSRLLRQSVSCAAKELYDIGRWSKEKGEVSGTKLNEMKQQFLLNDKILSTFQYIGGTMG